MLGRPQEDSDVEKYPSEKEQIMSVCRLRRVLKLSTK